VTPSARTPRRRRRRLALVIPLALVVAAMAAVYAAAAAGHLGASSERNANTRRVGNFGTGNPTYATQSGSLKATRRANIRFQNAENYDQSFEACKELGLDVLASQFHVAATPVAVAREWAAAELPAFYRGTFTGCRDALSDTSPPPFRKPDVVSHAPGG
jgi:hypothetical protein